MNANAFTIEIEGATTEELSRGVAAAVAVFTIAGTTALEAATAAHLREMLHEGGYYDEQGNFVDPREGFPLEANEVRLTELTERQHRIAPLCGEADAAAVEACCVGWPSDRLPATANLSLVHEEIWGMSRADPL
jgi:hypothetical protein